MEENVKLRKSTIIASEDERCVYDQRYPVAGRYREWAVQWEEHFNDINHCNCKHEKISTVWLVDKSTMLAMSSSTIWILKIELVYKLNIFLNRHWYYAICFIIFWIFFFQNFCLWFLVVYVHHRKHYLNFWIVFHFFFFFSEKFLKRFLICWYHTFAKEFFFMRTARIFGWFW